MHVAIQKDLNDKVVPHLREKEQGMLPSFFPSR